MARRHANAVAAVAALYSAMFAEQRVVARCSAPKIAVLTPRRAGKTRLICTIFLADAIKKVDGQYLYLALTRPSAKRIAWSIFKSLNREFKLGCKFLEADLCVVTPSGSRIYLLGVDQANWVDRVFGMYLDAAAIDEAASYQIDIEKFIKDVLKPCLADRRGQVYMVGTPQDNIHCFFFDVTRPEEEKREPGWEVFTWSTLDNPYMKDQWEQEIAEQKAINPAIEVTPGFRRHYLGQWVVERINNVYLYDEMTNEVRAAPPRHPEDRYTLGLDFGWDDAQAFVVGLYNPTSPTFYALEAYKEPHMTLDKAAERVRAYQEKYPGIRIVGDPARKQLMMELVVRFSLPIDVAEKTEKHAIIELFNTDLVLGKTKLVMPECTQLKREITTLTKLYKFRDNTGKWEEHPKQPNDCCDCLLYAWRDARHYLFQERPRGPDAGTPEYFNMMASKMEEQEMKRAQSRKGRSWWKS